MSSTDARDEPDAPARTVARATVLPAHRRSQLRDELLLSLELAALAAFAFTRPVLDSFGRSPETFLSRGVTGESVVVFAVAVAFVPAVCVAAVGVGARRLGGWARPWAQPVLVGIVGGLGAWRLGQDLTGWPRDATKLLLVAPLVGVALVVLRKRVPATRTFLRIAGPVSVVYLVLFLVSSPASALLSLDGAAPDLEPIGGSAELADDPPDVLYLVFDGLPVWALLDGTGHIDDELYPHFGVLAGGATWYRNNTTVAGFTQDAVPALLTGRLPSASETGLFRAQDPENLFTLLGGSYEAQVKEQVTGLCPTSICPVTRSAELGPLFGDAVDHWVGGAGEAADGGRFVIPGLVQAYEDAEGWIDGLGTPPDEAPQLVFHHMMLPHSPWRVTDDGTVYAGTDPPTGLGLVNWDRAGLEVGRQRLILQLQAADRLLGRHLDRLREAGTYDDTLVVVTSDHGLAMSPDQPSRGLSADNYDQIMWTPLIIKHPGQQEAAVDDRDVRSVDVVPTIAEAVGAELPWEVDGEPIGVAPARDGRTKPFHDNVQNELRAESGETMLEVDAEAGFAQVLTADAVPATGPDAVWRRTAHGALFGLALDEVDVGEPVDASIAVEDLASLDDLAAGEPPPIEVVGRTADLDPGTVVAYALNGTIGAVTEVEAAGGMARPLAHGLLPPDLFLDGANDLTAYVVDGPPGNETLRPVTVSAAT
jgi:hypothetical protein